LRSLPSWQREICKEEMRFCSIKSALVNAGGAVKGGAFNKLNPSLRLLPVVLPTLSLKPEKFVCFGAPVFRFLGI